MNNDIRIKIIERFDFYYSGINNKGAFILAFNTFLIGAFLVGHKDLTTLIGCRFKYEFNLIIGLLMICSITSMIFTIISMIPYLDSKGVDDRKSNWFFNDIATDDKETFFDRINSQKNDDTIIDLNNQIFELSRGLRKKHRFTKVALIFNLIEVFLLFPIIALILI
ncbi:DUF5706 domain-containing protein [Cytophagaceae bacterium ABcell3]|nr:DUF5706 domain-containing protein [Cytophagaceae bacterium ABcell3]